MTLYEKGNSEFADLPFQSADEWQLFGNPPLVSIDLDNEKIVIDASDSDLADRTFQVIINCHINVNTTV